MPGGHIEKVRLLSLRKGQHGKAEHIGGRIHPPLLQVNGMDTPVIGKEHIHLAGYIHPLRR